MKVTSFFTAAFAALAAASPVEVKKVATTQQLATFDDLPSVPAISQINPVGNYRGLNFKSWNVLQQGVAGIITTGIQPQSGVNAAATAVTELILRGAPAFLPAKPYKSFDLQSLYFACVVNSAESVAGVPQQCTIAFTAYKAGSSVPFQTLNRNFDPTNPLLSKMTKASFPSSWSKLSRVDVAVVQATTTEALNGLLIDNVAYKLYK